MRPDANRVIVERERRGGWGHKPGRTARDTEDLPMRGKISRRWNREYKELSDNLNLIKNFLRKNIGKPWSVVYREIREHNHRGSKRGNAGNHFVGHVFDYVDRAYLEQPWYRRRSDKFFIDAKGFLRRYSDVKTPKIRYDRGYQEYALYEVHRPHMSTSVRYFLVRRSTDPAPNKPWSDATVERTATFRAGTHADAMVAGARLVRQRSGTWFWDSTNSRMTKVKTEILEPNWLFNT